MNAIVTSEDFSLAKKGSNEINVIGCGEDCLGITFFTKINDKSDFINTTSKNIYVPKLILEEDFLNALTDYVYLNDAKFLIRAASSLEEVGLCDVKFSLSPVMLLHKCGLLDRCALVGGAYLDKEDLSLVKQENSSIILTPTFDAGYGLGVANIAAIHKIGVRAFLGTMDGKYNPSHDLVEEIKFLKLYTNASLKKENAVPNEFYNSLVKDK